MIRVLLLLFACSLTAPGCSSKPDCDAFAAHMVRVGTARGGGDAEIASRAESMRPRFRDMCTKGQVTPKQIDCVMDVNTLNDAYQCMNPDSEKR